MTTKELQRLSNLLDQLLEDHPDLLDRSDCYAIRRAHGAVLELIDWRVK